MTGQTWQRCEHCGFSTALLGDHFKDHECNARLADPAQKLWPLFHTCGAVALYSRVPVVPRTRVPHVRHLLLADGRTPLWSPTRAMLTGRAVPKSPPCPACGGSVNRALRTRPMVN